MWYAKFLGSFLLAASLVSAGCSGKDKEKGDKVAPKEKEKEKEKDHPDHGAGPNGGVVFDLGKYHAELTVNHDTKEITVLFLKDIKGKKEKEFPPEPVAAKEFTLTTKETKTKKEGTKVAPMTIKMVPKDEANGKASKFVGTDPGLANVADFEGTVTGEIDGKPAKGDFKEE